MILEIQIMPRYNEGYRCAPFSVHHRPAAGSSSIVGGGGSNRSQARTPSPWQGTCCRVEEPATDSQVGSEGCHVPGTCCRESESRQQTPKSALEDAMCLKIAKPGLSMAHPKLAYSLSGLQSVLAEERRCREHKAQGNTKQEDHYKAPGLDACSDHHSAD
eukprot:scpid100973/ scgid24123/ 